MEVYSDVTPLVAKLERTQTQIVAGVIGALSLLYLLMLWMAGRSDRILREQEAQRVANEARVRYQAYHDPLTGLPNRASFVEHLEEAIRRSKRFGWSLGLMFLDLDRFKRVNDSLGHEAGDELLRVAASRLQGCIRESDMLFRMGGDEFTVLLENVKRPEEAAAVAARMTQALAEPIELRHHELTTTVSIGIALYPKDDRTGERLVKSADTAMYRAKELGRNRYAFFTQEMNDRVESQLVLEAGLQRAVRNDEFVLHYQPRVSAATRRVVGVEALLRWQHPERGLVPPGELHPAARGVGADRPGRRAGDRGGLPPEPGVAGRGAAADAGVGQHLVAPVPDRVARGDGPRGAARERAPARVARDRADREPAGREQRARGRGHGAAEGGRRRDLDRRLRHRLLLARLPQALSDRLAQDRPQLRQDLRTSATDAAIVDAISALAHSLGLGLVAEGVEEAGQADFLRARYCTEMQGYLFGRPVPPEEMADAVRRLARGPERLASTA